MIMSDVASIVATVLAALLAMPGIALLYAVFFPSFARKAEIRVTRNPILTFVCGLVAALFIFGFAAIVGQAPAPGLKFFAVVFGLGGAWLALSGLSGIAGRIGHAMPSPVDRDQPWRAIVRGSVILELACLFPVVGWLLIYPVALAMGMGAAVLAIFPASQPVPQFAPAPAPAAVPPAFIPVASPAPQQPAFAAAGPEEVMHR